MFSPIRNISWESERTKRVSMGMVILAVLAAALGFRQLTPFIFDGLVVVLVWFATYEIFNAKRLDEKGVKDYYFYPYVAIAYLTFLLGILVATPFVWWLHVVLQVVLVFVLCIYVYLMSYSDKDFVKECKLKKVELGKASLGVVREYLKVLLYPAFLLFLLIPINHLDRWASISISGTVEAVTLLPLMALLLIFIISMFTDTAAFVVGRLMKGQWKLCPKISPGKTWAGAIAGLFGGVIGALLVVMVMTTNPVIQAFLTERIGYSTTVIIVTIAVGLVGSILNQAGDIYASWLKRRCGIKDFSKLIPGHGGIMDRLDGVIWVASFIFVLMLPLVFV